MLILVAFNTDPFLYYCRGTVWIRGPWNTPHLRHSSRRHAENGDQPAPSLPGL